MIDDKKIEEAARETADLYEQDLPIMSYNEDTEVDGQHHFCQAFGAELFKDGVKWAIKKFLKDLWHPAEEEPTIVGEDIVLDMFVDNKRHVTVEKYMVGEKFVPKLETINWIMDWKHLIKKEDGAEIKRWFYLKDLLTKTEEQ
jgi:hypothetical protein